MKSIVQKAEEWIKDIHYNSDHLLRTGYWIKKLDQNASDELIVACITHDAERAFPEGRIPRGSDEEGEGVKWDDDVYNLWHGKRSADFVEEFLKENNVTQGFIDKVRHLIERHEMGGDADQNLIQAADSISFLEINVPRFISNIPAKWTKEQVKEKFEYMFNRIQIDEAKKLAELFYIKGIKDLEDIS